jgi:ATP-dependent DNA ligase
MATRLTTLPKREADLIEPMDCSPVTKLIDGPGWVYEIKLDGYRAIGDELTAEKMEECVSLRPEAVAQIEFLEWTVGDRLRHSKFVGLREDKDARSVVKGQP